MNNALELIKYIFTKFLNLIFNDFEMFTGVTIGWVMVAIIILAIMIDNILSVAKSSTSFNNDKNNMNNLQNNSYNGGK